MKVVTIPIFAVVIVGLALWISAKALRVKLRQPPVGYLGIVEYSHRTNGPLPQPAQTPQLRRQLILSSSKPSSLSNSSVMSTSTLDFKKELPKKPVIYGFLHPKAAAGGGGERVLWAAIRELFNTSPNAVAALYVSAGTPRAEVLCEAASERFGIQFTPQQVSRVVTIELTQTLLVEPETFPLLTLLGQALGMSVLGYEAISNLMPDVFVDTTGLAFSYPIVSFFAKIPIVSYVHYPFVQKAMIAKVKQQSFKSPKRWAKLVYYHILSKLYNWAGSFCTEVTVNSTWTKEHLEWPNTKEIVFPPCAVQDFPAPKTDERQPVLVYLAQFRPEKRHELVITEFAAAKEELKRKQGLSKPHLILIGSVRDEIDQARVTALHTLAHQLKLKDSDYTIVTNAPWVAVKNILYNSSIGLNAMWNEHFGMSVVEVMAAGLIPVVHASAGPFLDIVKDIDSNLPPPGFFFRSETDPDGQQNYPSLKEAIVSALQLDPSQQYQMRERAHLSAQRFSDAAFAAKWSDMVKKTTAESLEFAQKRKAMQLYD